MATHIEADKKTNENTGTLIRRFTKRVQNSGLVRRVRSLRYHDRPPSATLRKRQALKKIDKKALYEKMAKLGKPIERRRRR